MTENPEINNHWNLNFQKDCKRKVNLPKVQPFKEYNFLPNNSVEKQTNQIKQYRDFYLSTDHIAIKTKDKKEETTEYKRPLFLEMKSKTILFR